MNLQMKHPLIISGNFVLILAAIVCVIGALLSAFSFVVNVGMMFVILTIAVLALVVIAAFWRGKGILALMAPALAMFLWGMDEIVEGAKWVIFSISTEYNKWLIVAVRFPDATADVLSVTLFFSAAGVALAFLLTIAICLRRSTMLTVLFTVPIVFLTFVIIYNQPDTRYLLGLLAVILTVLISGSLHSDDFKKRGMAVLPALALAVLLMGFTYILASPKNFEREGSIEPIDFHIRNIASRLGLAKIRYGVGWPFVSLGEWSFDTNSVSISDAGTRVITDQGILKVTASEAGTFYIRAYSMQRFDGRRWLVNANMLFTREEVVARAYPRMIASVYMEDHPYNALTFMKNVNMSIERLSDVSSTVTLTPYYGFSFREYYIEHDDSFVYTDTSILKLAREIGVDDFTRPWLDIYAANSYEKYTEIDASTADGLRRLAYDAGIDPAADRATVVDQVSGYIRSAGRYTLTPYVIPEQEDFALYFLETSQQGYCIHFATAATLMLRALGIPARFTSGFVARVPHSSIGLPVTLTDRNAHAWVEVFYEEAGWLPLEVTPASSDETIPDARPHSPGNSVDAPDERQPATPPDWVREYERENDPNRTTPTSTPTGAGAGSPDGIGIAVPRQVTIVAVCILAACLAIVLHWILAGEIRKRRFAQQDTNMAVIRAWRYIKRLDRKREQPEDMEELAFKARFSQHTISEDERDKMVAFAKEQATEVYYVNGIFGKFWLFIRGL